MLSAGLSLQAQMLKVGDAIKLDFSSTTDHSGVLYDWNLLQQNTSIPAGSVRLNGSASLVSGVAVNVNGTGSNLDANTMNWPGFANDPYHKSNTEAGLIYSTNAGLGVLGNTYEFNITFSGPNPGMLFNVRVYRLINENLANFNIGVTNGTGLNLSSNINRQAVFSETTLDPKLIFNGVSPNAAGKIVISIGSNNAIGAEVLVLEVVPAPSTWTMMGVGAAGLGLTLRQRRSARRA